MSDLTSAQHALVLDHLRLAGSLARQYRGRGVDPDDLEQVARLALVRAATRFDQGVGEFPPFATATIKGELKRHFRDRAWGVRPPRRIQELQARLAIEHPGDITTAQVEALAQRLGVDAPELTEALAARGCYTPDSLDAAVEAGHESGRSDVRLLLVDEWVTFCRLCKTLPVKDRQLLCWRFVEDLTQQEIGDRLGISQMQVSRRLTTLIAQLRAQVTEPPLAA